MGKIIASVKFGPYIFLLDDHYKFDQVRRHIDRKLVEDNWGNNSEIHVSLRGYCTLDLIFEDFVYFLKQ